MRQFPKENYNRLLSTALSCEQGKGLEVLFVNRQVFFLVGLFPFEPLLLLRREGTAGSNSRKCPLGPFNRSEERILLVRRVFHHGDNVGQGFVILDLVRSLEVLNAKPLWCCL